LGAYQLIVLCCPLWGCVLTIPDAGILARICNPYQWLIMFSRFREYVTNLYYLLVWSSTPDQQYQPWVDLLLDI
jgi:hypothetical protein